MSERISAERLDELIVLATNANGMWHDESSRTALAGWRELKDLRRIEQAARDVIASGENTCGEGRTLADLDKFRLAMEALRSALDSP